MYVVRYTCGHIVKQKVFQTDFPSGKLSSSKYDTRTFRHCLVMYVVRYTCGHIVKQKDFSDRALSSWQLLIVKR